ncbi:unnamed protein product, partial [Prorocentrum cordatum]
GTPRSAAQAPGSLAAAAAAPSSPVEDRSAEAAGSTAGGAAAPHGLASRPELHVQVGAAAELDSEMGRWCVNLPEKGSDVKPKAEGSLKQERQAGKAEKAPAPAEACTPATPRPRLGGGEGHVEEGARSPLAVGQPRRRLRPDHADARTPHRPAAAAPAAAAERRLPAPTEG